MPSAGRRRHERATTRHTVGDHGRRVSGRSWVGGLPVGLAPLRTSRDFRLLFWAGTVLYLGGMVSYVAVPYLLYSLTRSNFAVGTLGVAELVPLLFFGLYGGTR